MIRLSRLFGLYKAIGLKCNELLYLRKMYLSFPEQRRKTNASATLGELLWPIKPENPSFEGKHPLGMGFDNGLLPAYNQKSRVI